MGAAGPVPTAFISSSGELGGAEGILLSVLEGVGPGWATEVIVLGDGPLVDRIRALGIPVAVVRERRRIGLAAAAFDAWRLLRRSRARVVHANGVRAALVAALGGGGGRPVLWYRMDTSRDGLLGDLIARRCRLIVGLSASVNDRFRDRLPERLRVVNPGVRERRVDLVAARERVRRRIGSSADAAVIVVAARLSPPKGQMDAIEALARVREDRPEAQLALLGSETRGFPCYRAALLERAADLDVARAVHFLGSMTVDEATDFVAGCDVLLAPSRYDPASGWREGFGLSAVEAMSVRTPVVAYRHGSFPEVLGECARFADEGDVAALAAEVARLFSDPELRERLAACGASLAQRYRPERTVAEIKACYREIGGEPADDPTRR